VTYKHFACNKLSPTLPDNFGVCAKMQKHRINDTVMPTAEA